MSDVYISTRNINLNTVSGQPPLPVIVVEDGGSRVEAHELVIYDKDRNEVARVVYRPDAPKPCGARVWIEITGGHYNPVKRNQPD